MKRRTLLVALLTTSTLIALPVTSFAENNCNRGYGKQQMSHVKGGHKDGKQGMMRIDRMARALDLSEEQKVEIEAIMESNLEAKDSLREQMIESRQALRALDTASPDYETNVENVASEIAGLEKDKIVNRSNVRKQIEAILTDEQKVKMLEMGDKRGKYFGKYRG